jgi:alkylation response protein AidB-like acyl-CoA dehydrogenase
MISELSEESRMLQDSVRDFAESELAPHVMEWDEAQRFPVEIIPKIAGLGLMGAVIPQELGGSGLSYPEFIVVMEELARVDGSIALFLAAHHSLCLAHVFLVADERQRARYIPPLATGQKVGAWCLSEPGSGSDASAARSTAVRDGSTFVLNGTKVFVTNGTFADTFVVMAVTDRNAGTKGITAFIVEKGTPGFIVGKKENKLGLRASETATLILEDCRIPAENLLGMPGRGFTDALRVLDVGRIGIAAMAVGIAQGAFEASLRYAKTRRAFGKELSEMQAIQFKLADMATEIDAARLLTRRAAERKQAGARITREASMAKLFASEMAVRVTNEAVQIHGGYGFIKDYPVEKFYRDVKLCTIGEGTSEIQRMVIARQILS